MKIIASLRGAKRRSNPGVTPKALWIASLMLAMTTILFFAVPAHAELDQPLSQVDTPQDVAPPDAKNAPPIELLNKYYDRCMSSIYTDLSTETRESFCACTAAQMKDAMTLGEMETLTGGQGTHVDNKKLAIDVMAPCLSDPLRETEFNACETETQYRHFYKTRSAYDDTCQCVAIRAGNYIQNYGHDLMAYTIAINPKASDDPALYLRQSPEFRNEVAKARTTCMNGYVYH